MCLALFIQRVHMHSILMPNYDFFLALAYRPDIPDVALLGGAWSLSCTYLPEQKLSLGLPELNKIFFYT